VTSPASASFSSSIFPSEFASIFASSATVERDDAFPLPDWDFPRWAVADISMSVGVTP
jgi:hypothetical protein